MSVEIRYFEGDENAQKNMSLASFANLDNTGSDYTNADYIQNGAPNIPYATLEPGVWKLNGTRKILSDEGKFFICGQVGTRLGMKISSSETISPADFSIYFYSSNDQWPERAEIEVIHGEGYMNEPFVVQVKGPELHFRYYEETADDVNNFCDGFEVWLYPKTGHRVKVRKVTVGVSAEIGDKELSNINLVTEYDPSLCSLPSDMLNFNIRVNGTKGFLLKEGNRVKLYKNGNLEHTMWIKEIQRISYDQYNVSSQSLIGTLDKKYYGKILSPGGELDGPRRDGNAWSYAKTVINHISNYGSRFSVNYVSSKAQDRGYKILIGYLPVCLEQEALRQVLFACGLSPSTTEGTLNLSEMRTDVTYEFTDKDIISRGKANRLKSVGVIEVYRTYEKYIEQSWDVETAYEVTVEIPRIAHMLAKPTWSEAEVGFEYGAGWLRATHSSLGDGWSLSNYIEFVKVPETQREDRNNNTKITIDNCTLIHNETQYSTAPPGYPGIAALASSDVLDDVFNRMRQYVQYRILVEQDVIVTTQHAGDYVRTLTPWGNTVEGWIISMDSTLTQNSHRARIKILGKEVS